MQVFGIVLILILILAFVLKSKIILVGYYSSVLFLAVGIGLIFTSIFLTQSVNDFSNSLFDNTPIILESKKLDSTLNGVSDIPGDFVNSIESFFSGNNNSTEGESIDNINITDSILTIFSAILNVLMFIAGVLLAIFGIIISYSTSGEVKANRLEKKVKNLELIVNRNKTSN